ncbi:hypothetical protein DL98DRAFT_524200 [Cadophora sp. DSE1049]|nr:hypothetical protein DL98DRAFT_524200 [Cadophora sp. DSE1049]
MSTPITITSSGELKSSALVPTLTVDSQNCNQTSENMSQQQPPIPPNLDQANYQSPWKKIRKHILLRGSYANFVPELDGFVRQGPFKFFALPRELRDIIYRFLLTPFYLYHKSVSQGKGRISLYFGKQTLYFEPHLLDDGYISEVNHENEVVLETTEAVGELTPNVASNTDRQHDETARLVRRKEIRQHLQRPHPSRPQDRLRAHLYRLQGLVCLSPWLGFR